MATRPSVGLWIPNGGARGAHRWISTTRITKGFVQEWAGLIRANFAFGADRYCFHMPFGIGDTEAYEITAYLRCIKWLPKIADVKEFVAAFKMAFTILQKPLDVYVGNCGSSTELTSSWEASPRRDAEWLSTLKQALTPIVELRSEGIPGIVWGDAFGAQGEGSQEEMAVTQMQRFIKDVAATGKHIGVEPRPYDIATWANKASIPSVITDTYFQSNDTAMVTPAEALGTQYVIISDTQADGSPHNTTTYSARCTLHLAAGRSIYVQPGATTTGSKTAADILTDAGRTPSDPASESELGSVG